MTSDLFKGDVRVDSIPWDSPDSRFLTIPYAKCDRWNYGGIYREVYIEVVNSTYIARLDLTAEWGGNWRPQIESHDRKQRGS